MNKFAILSITLFAWVFLTLATAQESKAQVKYKITNTGNKEVALKEHTDTGGLHRTVYVKPGETKSGNSKAGYTFRMSCGAKDRVVASISKNEKNNVFSVAPCK